MHSLTSIRYEMLQFAKQGLASADDDRFLKLWFEPSINAIEFTASSRETAQAMASVGFH